MAISFALSVGLKMLTGMEIVRPINARILSVKLISQ
jgi:hypothetical protein